MLQLSLQVFTLNYVVCVIVLSGCLNIPFIRLFFIIFGLLPNNRLTDMKAYQATQPVFTQFSGFYEELHGGSEELSNDAH